MQVDGSKTPTIVAEDVREIAASNLPWEHLSGCRVVVTGAGGFLGGYIARTLLALYRLGKVSSPVRVIALVRDLERAKKRFSLSPDGVHLQLIHWDLNSIAIPPLADIQYVIHAASQASPRFYGTDPVGTMLPNIVGTAALLESLRRCADARGFMFVSSSEIYGSAHEEALVSESNYGILDPTVVRACYAESKRAGEAMCVAWKHQYGVPAFIVRPFHTYGPGLTPEDGRVFADFAFNVARNENIIMNSAGLARRAFCYVSDAVAGFFAVLLTGSPALPYNVANSRAELSVMELAEMLIGLHPEKRLRIDRRFDSGLAYLPSAVSRIIPDTRRIEALGWSPLVTPEVGFKRMIEACSETLSS